jgi:hypothetical protein
VLIDYFHIKLIIATAYVLLSVLLFDRSKSENFFKVHTYIGNQD